MTRIEPADPPRLLGATGLAVSPIGLGLAALGRPGYLNLGHGDDLDGAIDVDALEARARDVLDAAWRGGVRYFDAARSYGRAEEFLGGWLADRGIEPSGVAVGSKWGYVYTAGWRVDVETHEVKDHALATLRQQWSESQALLGRHLDLYQAHSVTTDLPTLDDAPLLRALAALKADGVRIGLSTSGPGQAEVIRRAAQLEVDGVRLFDAVQATWNLLERSAGEALAEAHAAGVGVIVKEALANGRIVAGRGDPAGDALAAHAARLGTTTDALALAGVLAQPWADVVLSGAVDAAQLEANLAAVEVPWDDDLEASTGALVERPDAYWRHRASLPWT